ncbi:histidine kinase [Ramlibacter sp. AW1]|uniref:histidine kinase n=1 Tax=Ramlibacter aurantiacus TaxID=2801330 RepID=A0A936ZQR5_9BURK|nr:ATP-binding protein [Ramlibacter aurantiacus]MBL0421981.1 histidine kinase [Ramlibacter aurantiacus]
MKAPGSIRARLILWAGALLLAFLVGAGLAVQRAHADSVRAAHYARLQSTVYLLLAAAELDAQGALVMPEGLAEPRLSLPGSGLYASIRQVDSGQSWRSASAVGREPPFRREQAVGEWRFETIDAAGRSYLGAHYGVRWAGRGSQARLVLSVVEDSATLARELAAFDRTLWTWLGGAAVLLLLAQTLLLDWALSPLRRVAQEVRRIESGEQAAIEQAYPAELAALTGNLNTLIQQERVRQTRYREALSFLAHSLKTPLAVLRTALADPQRLPAAVTEQVERMDHIVQHQLGRAAASGSAAFVAPLALAPVAQRIVDSLAKIYAERGLSFTIDCPPDLSWRLDEGDAFEMLGNTLDNAAKWARRQVVLRVRREAGPRLRIQVEDDGPGFSDHERVLQLHVRGDERVPGHGVGLAVVKDLVDSHGGTLTLSRGSLGGAWVDIALPARAAYASTQA